MNPHRYLFTKYTEEYGVFCNDGSIHTGELVGFRDDAPDEVKKSWQEYLQDRAKWDEEGWT